MRASDHELAGRVHKQYQPVVKEFSRLLGKAGLDSWYQDLAYIVLNSLVHGGIHLFLAVFLHCGSIVDLSETAREELVVLG